LTTNTVLVLGDPVYFEPDPDPIKWNISANLMKISLNTLLKH
jgi:hypothetical protein